MMSVKLPVHTLKSAPPASIKELKEVDTGYGFIPNLMGVMASSPAVLTGYRALAAIFETASLTPTERQVVLLTTSYENNCAYCMAAHTAIATMQRVDDKVIESLRNGTQISDPKLEILRAFTLEMVTSRGWPSESIKQQFLDAGYSPAAMLEVVLGIGLKTISNYVNHLSNTPLDQAFIAAAWHKPVADKCNCAN